VSLGARTALACAALVALSVACGKDGEAPSASRPPPAQDDRIAWLLAPAPRDDYYGVDTSDSVGILVQTLKHGQRDPMRSARMELAAQGQSGLEAARRMIEAAWNDPDRFADIRNALDVAAYSKDPAAHDVIRKVLDHEHPTPRMAAWRALKEHPRPEDYDRVRALFDEEGPDSRPELAQLMHLVDPERAEDEFLAWIAAGQNSELWRDLAIMLAGSTRERTHELCCALYDGKDDGVQAMLAAACARSGDPAPLERLHAYQRGENALLRQVAIEALAAAGLVEELRWTLENDQIAALRLLALQAIGRSPRASDLLPLIEQAASDSDDMVSATATSLLVVRGDTKAIERCLQDLTSDRPGASQNAINALTIPLHLDPALARRALDRLMAREQAQEGVPLALRSKTLHLIGMVPLEETASCLHGLALQAKGKIEGMPAERWLVLQIGNAGEPGQRYLIGALAEERDPLRRIDLIEALSANPTELARRWLLERAEAPDVTPYELLYIADRLVRLGPLERAAPVLKRATLRVDQADVRRALQGLLWTWYPGPQP
jgi:hypothetical protein